MISYKEEKRCLLGVIILLFILIILRGLII